METSHASAPRGLGPADLANELRELQREALAIERDLVLRLVFPGVIYSVRLITLQLQVLIEEAEALAAAQRRPTRREMEHRLHALVRAGVVCPAIWWQGSIAGQESAA